tara:strand:- start:635 stop:1378 length:744 start_codon:yes stop_codon:yes gene_type:complete
MKIEKKLDLTLLLCTFNEEKRVRNAIKNILDVLSDVDFKYEIIVIDNNSTDNTKKEIIKLNDSRIKNIFNSENIGKGGSIKKGINISNSHFIMIFDPDLEYAAEDIIKMYDEITKSKSDFIIGSRRLNKTFSLNEIIKDKNKGFSYSINYLGVFFLTTIINILYKQSLTDSASALKIFKTDFIKKIKLNRNGFNLDFELVCRSALNNGKILEIPIDYFPRSKKDGKKIKALKDGFLSLIAIIQDRII